jgi:hypothetical protein
MINDFGKSFKLFDRSGSESTPLLISHISKAP